MDPQPNDIEKLKAPEDYELQSIITGEQAATLLSRIMSGDDPSDALAKLTVALEGQPLRMKSNMIDVRSQLMASSLKRVHSSVDSTGKDALQRFHDSLSPLIAERIADRVKAAEARRIGFHAEVLTELEANPDNEWARNRMQMLMSGKAVSQEPIYFSTDYHGVEEAYGGGYEGDNDLLETALISAATIEMVAESLNRLLPNKLSMGVALDGEITVFIDGRRLSPSAQSES
jgi:hypothetical protein